MTLTEMREKIDDLDESITYLLTARFRLCHDIGVIKNGKNIYDPKREEEILSKISNEHIREVFKTILKESKKAQEAAVPHIDLDLPIDYTEPYCNFDKESFSCKEKDSKIDELMNDKRVKLAKTVAQAAITKSVSIQKSF